MEELAKLPAIEMLNAIRAGIKELIKQKPDAKAEDVLKQLDITEDMMKLVVKHLSK